MHLPGLQTCGVDGRGDAGAQWARGAAGEAVSAALSEVREHRYLEFHRAGAAAQLAYAARHLAHSCTALRPGTCIKSFLTRESRHSGACGGALIHPLRSCLIHSLRSVSLVQVLLMPRAGVGYQRPEPVVWRTSPFRSVSRNPSRKATGCLSCRRVRPLWADKHRLGSKAWHGTYQPGRCEKSRRSRF